jgi:hypothetical protein
VRLITLTQYRIAKCHLKGPDARALAETLSSLP